MPFCDVAAPIALSLNKLSSFAAFLKERSCWRFGGTMICSRNHERSIGDICMQNEGRVSVGGAAAAKNKTGGFLRQAMTYYGVSVAQTFVEFGVFAVMQLLGLATGTANGIAVACSGSFNFLMNRNITFKASSNFWRSVVLFILLYLWNFLFGTWFISATASAFGLPQTVSKFITMAMQGVWGFCLCKWVIFK